MTLKNHITDLVASLPFEGRHVSSISFHGVDFIIDTFYFSEQHFIVKSGISEIKKKIGLVIRPFVVQIL